MNSIDVLSLSECICHEPWHSAPDGSLLQLRINRSEPSPCIGMKASIGGDGPPMHFFLRLDDDHFGDRLQSDQLNRVSALDVTEKVEICASSPAIEGPTHPLRKGDVFLLPDGAMFIYSENLDQVAWVCARPSDNFAIGSVHYGFREQYKSVGKGAIRLKNSD